MFKVLTCIEKASFAKAFSRMFTGDRHCVKRLNSLFLCYKPCIKRRLPIYAVVPSHCVLMYLGLVAKKQRWKLVMWQ